MNTLKNYLSRAFMEMSGMQLVVEAQNFQMANVFARNNQVIFFEDGDNQTKESIGAKMRQYYSTLKARNGEFSYEYFVVFVFTKRVDTEIQEEILTHKQDLSYDRKFMTEILVSLEAGSVDSYPTLKNMKDEISSLIKGHIRSYSSDYKEAQFTNEAYVALVNSKTIHFSSDKPIASYIILGFILFIGIIPNLFGNNMGEIVQNLGVKLHSKIVEGEIWRFLTPMFLHASPLHLMINSFSLFSIGPLVEKIFGWKKFIMIYFLAGFLGNFASFAFADPLVPGVGASGAIFGLVGALVYFILKEKKKINPSFIANIVVMIAINLAYGLMNTNIDNYAHAGGLVGGFLIASTTGLVNETKSKIQRGITLFLFGVLSLVCIMIGYFFVG